MILVAPNIANSEVRVLQHAYCDCTGIIEIKVTGCWPPYIGLDYRLTMNAIDHFSPEPSDIVDAGALPGVTYYKRIENLCPGDYTFALSIYTFVPIEGWKYVMPPMSATINGGGGFTVHTNLTNAPCYEDAYAEITITGGTPPFKIMRCDNTKEITTTNRTHTFTKLTPGSKCYKIIDAWGCEQTVNFEVDQQSLIQYDLNYPNILCGDPDGTGWAEISNITGTNDYSIRWKEDDVQRDDLDDETLAENLSTGCYKVRVIDNITGCAREFKFCIKFYPIPEAEPEVTDAGCTAYQLGKIEMSPHQEGANYKLFKKNEQGEWIHVNTQENPVFSNLGPGVYKICTWFDINCQNCFEVTINAAQDFQAYAEVTKHPGCFEDLRDGEISIMIIGGTRPYIIKTCDGEEVTNYTIDEDNESYQIIRIKGLPPGSYCFKIYDSGNCPPKIVDALILEEPEDLLFYGLALYDIKENGNCYSLCRITDIQGTPPYTVEWLDEEDNVISTVNWDGTPPAPSNIIQSFPATHRVRITDAKGCIRTERAINVACETTGGIIGIFSNPTYGDISIEIDVNLPLPNVKTKIFNLSMSQVHQKDYGLLAEGTHIVQDNISHLSPGMYYIGAYFDNEPVGNIFLILLSQ